MALDLTAVKVIVYDLDGTIYDDNRHFVIYAREIQSRLPEEVQSEFWTDYEATLAGGHPALRVGTFYDVDRDVVLHLRAGRVVEALHWDGSPLPPIVRNQLYGDAVHPDHETIMNVGDLWWVPSAISAHYGGSSEGRNEAFLRVRDIMADPSFEVRPIPELQETIAALKGQVVQVLATNSPQPDSEAILAKVGLTGAFDRHYFRSNKPMGLRSIFDTLSNDYGVPMSAILSVGDNLVNEIAPARAMGCQTAFIDPHGVGDGTDADLTIETMSDLIPVLRRRIGS